MVLEVGLGGRADSTNVVAPVAALVTAIEYEHADVLGDTLAAIALEKCGIFKPGAQLWVGCDLPQEALAVATEQAAALDLKLRMPAIDAGDRWPHPLPVQRANLALAHAVLANLPNPLHAGAAALRALAPEELCVPGRWEHRRAADGRTVVFDIAHTVESLVPVLAAFREIYPQERRGVVFALRDDKDAAGLAAALGPRPGGERWFATWAGDHPRSADPSTIAASFAAEVLATPALPPGPEVLLVTGSTYLVGALRPQTTSA